MVKRTKNSIPLRMTDINEHMKIGRLYASGKQNELIEAFTLASNQNMAEYISTTYFNELTPNQQIQFIKGILIENTTVNLCKTSENGIRLRVCMTDERLAPFKDKVAWTVQEELFNGEINYIKLNNAQCGFYFTNENDRQLFLSYLFESDYNYEMSLEFDEIIARKKQQALRKYGRETVIKTTKRGYIRTRRKGYSIEFQRRMTINTLQIQQAV